MERIKVILMAGIAGTSLSPLIDAETFECTDAQNCEVRLWDPQEERWGEPEEVPDGTIVDTAWAMPWGDGWEATDD